MARVIVMEASPHSWSLACFHVLFFGCLGMLAAVFFLKKSCNYSSKQPPGIIKLGDHLCILK